MGPLSSPEFRCGKGFFQTGRRVRGGTSTRLHPKRRASIDNRPGPNIARVQLMVASNDATTGSADIWKAILHTSTTATEAPTMGVQRPAIKKIPHTARRIREMLPLGPWIKITESVRQMSATPRTRRMIKRPTPGQPPANVEYRRRNVTPFRTSRLPSSACPKKPPKEAKG